MPKIGRVTITLSNDLLREIDRQEKNRSKFVAEAVRRELDRRRRTELQRSLENPHPESEVVAEQHLKSGHADCRRKTVYDPGSAKSTVTDRVALLIMLVALVAGIASRNLAVWSSVVTFVCLLIASIHHRTLHGKSGGGRHWLPQSIAP